MRIIIVGTAYPYRGGLAAFNERLAMQFQSEGHEVEMVTFTMQYPSFLFPGKTQFSSDSAPENLKITRKINSVNPLNWIKTGVEIGRKNADLVIFCYWMSFMAPCFGTIARQIHKNKKTKCIGLIHNIMPHEPSILDKLFPQYFVRQMDGFVALSQSVVDDIARIDKQNKPKAFSPHPIYDHYGELLNKEMACAKLHLDTTQNYLLFFGFIRAYKGLDLLIAAMADERVRHLGVKLIVAGEFYEDEAVYKKQMEQLGVSETIVLHNDFISNDAVNAYFSVADMVVLPYKTATQSGVTQVAFHFEKPVLVSNVGGLGEIVKHGEMGYSVVPNAQAIADGIVDFYKNNRNADFVKCVRQEKIKYGWDKMTREIMDVH